MAFIGSARKWRPQRFEELIGQEHIRRTLSNALASGRVASAYLFSGTRGVGKTTTARILAKALNCESGDGPLPEPCNECSSCEEITRGSHPDILEIDAATYTGVDNVRELREGLRYQPARGRYKTVIFDEVHMLSKSSFNALLKTLEEPPPHVVFILATTEVKNVPDTILSRCQVFEFRRITTSVIAAHLSKIVDAQGRKMDEAAVKLLARMGEGSIRDAQSLLDQVLAFAAEDPVSSVEVEKVLGVPSGSIHKALVEAVIARDGNKALTELKGLFDAGHDLKLFSANLLEYLRDCMVLLSAGDEEALFDVAASEVEDRKQVATKMSFAEAHQAYSILQGAEFELRTSDHPRMTLEVAILRMCQIEPIADLGALMERLESISGGKAPNPPHVPSPKAEPTGGVPPPATRETTAPATSPPATEPASGSSPVAQAEAQEWNTVQARRIWTGAVEALRPMRRPLFHGVELDLETEGIIRVVLARENRNAQGLHMAQEVLPEIEEFFRAHSPWSAKVEIAGVENGAHSQTGQEAGETSNARVQKLDEHEEAVIQEIVDLFNGKIVDIRHGRMRKSGGNSYV
ncbi:MAG: DNA polymerase III subunit gamma/tau [Nitrospinae bacterium]|nr:DNA polymerase III subunit gamma/tau [Nitrospinota bacterium]